VPAAVVFQPGRFEFSQPAADFRGTQMQSQLVYLGGMRRAAGQIKPQGFD
jgi:hypothetical protein